MEGAIGWHGDDNDDQENTGDDAEDGEDYASDRRLWLS